MIPPLVQEIRSHTKKQYKYKKRKKYVKIIEELIKIGQNLAKTESYKTDDQQSFITEQIDNDETEDELLKNLLIIMKQKTNIENNIT